MLAACSWWNTSQLNWSAPKKRMRYGGAGAGVESQRTASGGAEQRRGRLASSIPFARTDRLSEWNLSGCRREDEVERGQEAALGISTSAHHSRVPLRGSASLAARRRPRDGLAGDAAPASAARLEIRVVRPSPSSPSRHSQLTARRTAAHRDPTVGRMLFIGKSIATLFHPQRGEVPWST